VSRIGLIGGSGAELYPAAAEPEILAAEQTHWGQPSSQVRHWQQHNHDIYFLSRHGDAGTIPPHKVNYRANLQILADLNVDHVVAMNAVGGISSEARPGQLVIPEQIIDYTWGRQHTYYDGSDLELQFVDFTEPYDSKLRDILVRAAQSARLSIVPHGIYGVTQGPRLESRAEIDRMERDGCSLVGMTAMPEAALARELGLSYASCCYVVNFAAGRSDSDIHSEIGTWLQAGINQTALLLEQFLQSL
jgi:5'-methylthioinosine phosphorylase